MTAITTQHASVAWIALDAAERFGPRTALTSPRGDPITYAELGTAVREIAGGLAGAGGRARRPRRDPLLHAARVDARGLRHPRRRRHRGADLPDELARGVRVRAPALGVGRGHLRGRRAAREGRARPRRVPGAHHRHPHGGRGGGHGPARRAAPDGRGGGGRRRRAPARRRGAVGRRHHRLHLRHDRAAQGVRHHARQPPHHGRHVRARARARRATSRCTCTCRWRTRSPASPRPSRCRSAGRWPSGAAIAKKIVEEVAQAEPTHFPSVPRVYEKIHTAVLSGVAEQSHAEAGAVRLGARGRAPVGGPPARGRDDEPPRPRAPRRGRPARAVQGPLRVRRPAAAGA